MSEKKEFIERRALLNDHLVEVDRDEGYDVFRPFIYADDLEMFPAADVEPVVRGEWKPDNRIFGAWHCSVCGESALCNGIEEEVKSAFCPYCGAKMNVN